jgi:hypothetical protein
VAPIDEKSAASLAAAIVAGAPLVPQLNLVPSEPGPFEDEVVAGDDSLEAVLESAFRGVHVLAISLGDPDGYLAEPMILVVTEWEPGRVVGTDLADGQTVVILSEHIGAVLDLGPIAELDLDELIEDSPDPPTRRPPPRRRR